MNAHTYTGKKGNTKLEWSEPMLNAFDQLKEAIAADMELSFPNYPRWNISAE